MLTRYLRSTVGLGGGEFSGIEFLMENFDFGFEDLTSSKLEPLVENLVWHLGDYAGRSQSSCFVPCLQVRDATRERRDIKRKCNRAIAFE